MQQWSLPVEEYRLPRQDSHHQNKHPDPYAFLPREDLASKVQHMSLLPSPPV